ncbi:MAG: sulfotransferase, partial [Pseudomonadota bacterium]
KLLERWRQLDYPPHVQDILAMNEKIISQATFGGQFRDRDTAIRCFEQQRADVQAAVPDEQLLVFDVAQGWEPLCRFLGVPVPDIPFPHHNLRADFWDVLGGEPA